MAEQKPLTTRVVGVVHRLFVTVAVIHLVLVAAQPVLAGWSLDGDGLALDLHGINGSIIVTVSMILIPLSVHAQAECTRVQSAREQRIRLRSAGDGDSMSSARRAWTARPVGRAHPRRAVLGAGTAGPAITRGKAHR